TAVLPVILATMSISDEIHLLTRFQRLLRDGAGARAAVERTARDLVTPVVLATTTTGVGFLSFLASPIAPVRAFGAGAALGIAYSLAFSLAVTPAILDVLPESWFRRREAEPKLRMLRWTRRPQWTLGVIAAVTLLAGVGLARLTVHDSWIESFAEGSPFRRQTAEVNRSLNGTHLLHVHLPFRAPTACADPRVVAKLGELEAFLVRQPQVGGVLGLHSQLTALSRFWNPGLDPAGVLGDRREVQRLLNRYELSPGLLRRRQVVDDEFSETIVTVFLKNANYRDTRLLMTRVEAWHREHLEPEGAGLGWAGDVAVSQATIPAIVRTQTLSLPIALLGVFLMIALLYGSPRLALAALFPVTVSAVWLLGALGWLGVPLGVATSMFFAIALGLGVDSQSIHFLDGYRRLRRTDPGRAVQRTIEEVGPAIMLNTAAVAVGFGLLAVSSVPANARLGLLIALALALGCVLTLCGLGSLLELGRASSSQPITPSTVALERRLR
ncbi:MAG TPA: MMPL family transporter, partial [Thermoanaerobaculia bacterium]|nr:MMPL family transporter [Thermoanaerobaculia bacterium]